MQTKVCTGCDIEKPATIEYFYPNKSSKYGVLAKCKECSSKTSKKYYQANQERLREYTKTYRKENPEKAKQSVTNYQAKNKEKVKEIFRNWYYANHEYNISRVKQWREDNPQKYIEMVENGRERKKEYMRLYSKVNREKINRRLKKWRKKNPNLEKKYQQKRRHLKYNSISLYLENDWCDTLQHFNNKCAYCQSESDILTQDHVIPVSKGGGYVRRNIVPACQSCNSSKGAKDMVEWYKKQECFSSICLGNINEWIGVVDGIQQISLI